MLLTAIAYFASGQLSFSASVSNQIVTPVFFAAEGFALAAVLLFGPWMAIGVFVGQLVLALSNNLAVTPALLISAINSSEALLGYYLFKAFKLDVRLQSAKDLGGLLALIFLVLQPFSATLGNLVLMEYGIVSGWASFWESWKSWWVGNCMGQAHIAPASLALYANPSSNMRRLFKHSSIPLLILACATWVVFNQHFNAGISLPLVIFTPLFIWLAIQGRLWMVCMGSMVLSVVALRSTSLGMGPFVSEGLPLLFEMNVFLLGLAITAQFVAVLYEERTMYEQALILARDKEHQASQAKTDFLANVSHEIRTPMNAIIGMTALARDESDSPKVKEMLNDAHHSGRSLLILLDQILDFSKIESGRMQIAPEAFDLQGFLRGIYSLFKIAAEQKDLEFDVQILSDDCPRILVADELRLKQVLSNLIGNSLKFTHRGAITLELNVTSESGLNLLHFAVRDSGVGITADQQSRIFSPFTQAEANISSMYGGTGLGLSISSELVCAMGSKLRCKSRKGCGAVFYFDLPIVSPDSEHKIPQGSLFKAVASEPALEDKTRQFEGLRVLVVDDHPLNLKIAAAVLHSLGAKVELAADGYVALEVFRLYEFDVVLMDLQMPGMSGAKCIELMRQSANESTKLPFIFGFTAATTLRQEDSQGLLVDGLLTKPLDPNALEKAMNQPNQPLETQVNSALSL